jgi:hypothetical protein
MTRNDSGSQLWHVSSDSRSEGDTEGQALFNLLDKENDTQIADLSDGIVNSWMSIDLLASSEMGLSDFYPIDGTLSLALVNNHEYDIPSGTSILWWEDKFNFYTKDKPTGWSPYLTIETYDAACLGDFDDDRDVDGTDLAALLAGGTVVTLGEFAENFGRIDCPSA